MLTSLQLLAQSNSGAGGAAAAGAGMVFLLLYIALIVLIIASFWKIFTKAGQPGWAAIIPIYNLYIMCKIAGRPGWWVILMFIPIVSFVIAIIVDLQSSGLEVPASDCGSFDPPPRTALLGILNANVKKLPTAAQMPASDLNYSNSMVDVRRCQTLWV